MNTIIATRLSDTADIYQSAIDQHPPDVVIPLLADWCREKDAELQALKTKSTIKQRFWNRQLTNAQAICELALTFPTLRDELPTFLRPELWQCRPDGSHGSERFAIAIKGHCDGCKHAARFILSVWNTGTKWKCGPFNLHDAMSAWDNQHRAAFLTWAIDPWWP